MTRPHLEPVRANYQTGRSTCPSSLPVSRPRPKPTSAAGPPRGPRPRCWVRCGSLPGSIVAPVGCCVGTVATPPSSMTIGSIPQAMIHAESTGRPMGEPGNCRSNYSDRRGARWSTACSMSAHPCGTRQRKPSAHWNFSTSSSNPPPPSRQGCRCGRSLQRPRPGCRPRSWPLGQSGWITCQSQRKKAAHSHWMRSLCGQAHSEFCLVTCCSQSSRSN